MNVETTVSPPLQSQGVDSQSSEPQRDAGGHSQVQRDEKRKDTHTEKHIRIERRRFYSQESRFC